MIPHTEYLEMAKKRRAGKTLESIAKPYSVSRERIRQILKDHFPEITAEVAGRTRKGISDRIRMKEVRPCACGCEIIIPMWANRGKWGWKPASRYVPGHQWRNRVPYKRTSIDRATRSKTMKRSWAEGKYDNRIRRDTIKIRRKLWTVLREHPEGMSSTDIKKATGIKHSTLMRWIKLQQYMKFTIHQKGKPGQPYIISLAKESPVNLEDEMCSPRLNLEDKKKNG